MILPCKPPVSEGARTTIDPPRHPRFSINGDPARRAFYNSHVLIERHASDDFPLPACLELNENSRLELESRITLKESRLPRANPQSALGMHVTLPKPRGRSRVQTWNRYAYVANNALSFI